MALAGVAIRKGRPGRRELQPDLGAGKWFLSLSPQEKVEPKGPIEEDMLDRRS